MLFLAFFIISLKRESPEATGILSYFGKDSQGCQLHRTYFDDHILTRKSKKEVKLSP
jgi:hypothetical protein